MKRPTCLVDVLCCTVVVWCCGLVPIAADADQTRTVRHHASSRTAAPSPSSGAPAEAPQQSAKVISYSDRDVARIQTKLRYTTLIILPKDEVILDFVCGDKDLWVINGDRNLAFVKPALEHSHTNLNLITAGGSV